MKGLTHLVVLLAVASLFVIHMQENPALWEQLATPKAEREADNKPVNLQKPAENEKSAEEPVEKTPEKDEEPRYKATLDEADRWIGKAAYEYWRCAAAEAKHRAEHANRLLEYTDEALNVLDWLDTVYPDHQDIQERMEETYKMRQAALRFGAGE